MFAAFSVADGRDDGIQELASQLQDCLSKASFHSHSSRKEVSIDMEELGVEDGW